MCHGHTAEISPSIPRTALLPPPSESVVSAANPLEHLPHLSPKTGWWVVDRARLSRACTEQLVQVLVGVGVHGDDRTAFAQGDQPSCLALIPSLSSHPSPLTPLTFRTSISPLAPLTFDIKVDVSPMAEHLHARVVAAAGPILAASYSALATCAPHVTDAWQQMLSTEMTGGVRLSPSHALSLHPHPSHLTLCASTLTSPFTLHPTPLTPHPSSEAFMYPPRTVQMPQGTVGSPMPFPELVVRCKRGVLDVTGG